MRRAIALNVLFLQIAAPTFEPRDHRSNVPLAAGNLASFANARFAQGPARTTILDRDLLDRAGDAALVDAVLRHAPDVLAATLYCWSSHRTLNILARIRAARPGLLTIVGGPEVDKGNDFLTRFAGAAFDAAASGEGEELFVEFLEAALAGRPLDTIAGLGVVRAPGTMQWAPPRAPVNDLSALPSPYLTKTVPLAEGGIQHVETARGCVFECDFCFYHADFRKVRSFPRKRVAAEIRHALDANVSDLYLMDPTFNGHSGYRETLRALRPELLHRKASVHTELRAEPMNVTNVRELSDSGITSVEVGLQTITPASLQSVGRIFERERFASGCRALLNGGIAVEIGTIIGLPNDTRAGIRETFEYAKNECGEDALTVPFILSLLPATVLRERAAAMGLRYRLYPPYTLLESPTFAEDDIRGALEDYENIHERELDAITPVRCVESGYACGARKDTIPRTRIGDAELLRRIIVNCDAVDPAQLSSSARELAGRVESTVAVIFRNIYKKADDPSALVSLILSFLRPLRDANPHGLLEAIVELDPRADGVAIARAVRAGLPPVEGHYLNEHLRYMMPESADISMRIIISLPLSAYEDWGAAIAQWMPVIWRIDDIGGARELKSLFEGPGSVGTLLFTGEFEGSVADAAALAGDDAADLRFADARAQRDLDAIAGVPAFPPETVAILGGGGRIAAIQSGL
ncbi:MAG: radical SAM protein [Planctomycetes bacterium]|nr:radical SAM protein [Planctomycetota bacterium]